jgi:hypothetical protein
MNPSLLSESTVIMRLTRSIFLIKKGVSYDIKFAARLGNRIAQKVLNEKGVVY